MLWFEVQSPKSKVESPKSEVWAGGALVILLVRWLGWFVGGA